MKTNRTGLTAIAAAAFAFALPAAAQGTAGQQGTTDQGQMQQGGAGGAMGGGGPDSATTGAQGSATAPPPTQQGAAGTQQIPSSLQADMQKQHAANQAEIQLGQDAQTKAQSPDVKSYAQQFATDHQQNDKQLQDLAQRLGVNLEGKTYQSAMKSAQSSMKKLDQKQGAAYDKAFTKLTVSVHKQDAQLLKKAAADAKKANQPELASYFQQTYGAVEHHLAMAKQQAATVQGRKPPAGGGGTTGGGTTGGGTTGGGTTGGTGAGGGAGGAGGGTGGSSGGGQQQ
jgi:putative membrane protein